MQLGNALMKKVVFVKKEFANHFGKEANFKEEKIDLEHHGWFLLKYSYLPKKYTISFEGEFNSFNIRIENVDGGFISLNQLVQYDNELEKINIRYAIKKLKGILEAEISFYKSMNNKLYKQINGEYKRIKLEWQK